MDRQLKEVFFGLIVSFVIAMIVSFTKVVIVGSFAEKNVEVPVIETAEGFTKAKMEEVREKEENEEIQYNFEEKLEDEIALDIIPIKKLSGMTKEEILNLRHKAVNKSIFASEKYSPNMDVYRVEDGLPWIGAYEITCNGTKGNANIGNGASRESVGVLNPAIIFYINMNASKFSTRNYCSEIDYLIPHRLTFSPKERTIRAYINYKDYYAKNKVFYNNVLSDPNARDLGYNYSYMDNYKNIRFKHEKNLSNSVVQTKGYYHRGFACGLSSGCNNLSPYVPEYEFYLTDVPAMFNIKLWKKEPTNEHQKADLNYQMIFE